MDIFSLFTLCGGLAFFLYGMTTMSKSLEKMAGGRLERLLKRMTSNPVKGLLLGAGITIAVQSSSAVTVMLVGLVNSGVMELGQTIGVIMGSNVGTTLTAWILSLTGIESESVFLNLLKPENFSPLFALAGILLIMGSKRQRRRDIGRILIGFAILMSGMEMMKNSVSPLADMPGFSDLLTAFRNPLLGVAVGAVFTGVIQSSAASVGILQVLAVTGQITYGTAIPIIMGQNIGTCVTAILSGIGASKNAKCVGYMHLMFNLIGTIIFSVFAMLLFTRIDPSIGGGIINQTQISAIHTVFNIGTTVLLIPLSKWIILLAMRINGITEVETTDEGQLVHLDQRMLQTPSLAVEGAKLETIRLGHIARENLELALSTLEDRDPEKISDVRQRETVVDRVCDGVSQYLIKLCMLQINDKENETVTSLLNTISDMERVGDHAENIAELAEEMSNEGIIFSVSAMEELKEMINSTLSSYDNAVKALELDDISYAKNTVVLEDEVDALEKKLRAGHIDRLSNAECNVNAGIHFLELLGNLERVSDHAMNIAQVVLNEHREEKHFHEEIIPEH